MYPKWRAPATVAVAGQINKRIDKRFSPRRRITNRRYLLRYASAADRLLIFSGPLLLVPCCFLAGGCTTAKTTKQIADQSHLHPNTVEVQRFGVPKKLRITAPPS